MNDEQEPTNPGSSFILHRSSLVAGIELFNAQKFWHAHEAWERLWLAATGDEKTFLQGLIQLAAAYHHVQRGTFRGAIRLFEAGLTKLATTSVHFRDLDCTDVVATAQKHRDSLSRNEHIDGGELPKFRYNEPLSQTQRNLRDTEGEMQEMDNRDRELLGALQGEIPLVSTPYAFLGQTLDMSEKEVIKRTERLKRDGVVRQLTAHFDARAIGYRTCLVAARVSPSRIDDAAAAINAHPGVTQNYRRNNDFNLWFTLFVSPQSKIGLEKTVDLLGREADCDVVRALPTLKLYKTSSTDGENHTEGSHGEYTPLTPQEIECVRLLQRDLPLQPRPFDVLARNTGVGSDELIATARTLLKRGQMRRFSASVTARKAGFVASAMGVWVVPHDSADDYAAKLAQHRAVSHCYLRPVYDDWPYNLYTTVHARSVDECESVINDLAIDTGIARKQALFPTKEYKKVRPSFFSGEEEEWEDGRGDAREVAAG